VNAKADRHTRQGGPCVLTAWVVKN
jgi:hypothetical protein